MNTSENKTDPDGFFQLLSDDSMNLARAFDALRTLRTGADENLSVKLDRALLMRIVTRDRTLGEIRDEVDGLQALLAKTTAPPYFLARFHRCVMMGDTRVAEVTCGRDFRLVQFAEELDPDTLAPGDVLYLSHDLNVALSRAEPSGSPVGEIATVDRITPDGRLVIRDHDTTVLVTCSGSIGEMSVRAGDDVLWDRDARMALAKLDRDDNETTALLEEVGDALPETLAGYDQVRDSTLRRFVRGVQHPELAEQYGLGAHVDRLLLTGPPGTGKTTLMKNIAAEIARSSGKPCRYRIVNGAELSSPWVGETERNIRRAFAELARHDGPSILFFDEIDAVGKARGRPMGANDDRAMGTILGCIDGMRSDGRVIVIAATNRADDLDPALRSRFSTEIEMPRPRMAAARAILNVHLDTGLPYRPNGANSSATRDALIEHAVSRLYDPNANNEIAVLRFRDSSMRTVVAGELVSGRLLMQICQTARLAAFERHAGGGAAGLTEQDMEISVQDAIDRLTRLLTRNNARNYLGDLPQDVDIVSVEPVRRIVPHHRYLQRPTEA